MFLNLIPAKFWLCEAALWGILFPNQLFIGWGILCGPIMILDFLWASQLPGVNIVIFSILFQFAARGHILHHLFADVLLGTVVL